MASVRVRLRPMLGNMNSEQSGIMSAAPEYCITRLEPMDTIAMRIEAVRERIAAAARRAGRSPDEIRLVGVSKTHPPELVAQALRAGLRDFGENRVQEA